MSPPTPCARFAARSTTSRGTRVSWVKCVWKSVEIAGFKSFCDKQELSFKGGITGVVGPNGCGKSNISDAINWVLGEQSAKSLRGTSMEDVIFNGSAARQPLQMAEVNLKVSGLNGNSPDGAPECVVSRRLYRNGESEYLMNGAVCRLRDIHELFMDTGLGSKAYSIIEQGKIGLILSSKPADRRALIEEAAGITKYKARRRQTQLKLEAAQQNLLRVNDIVHEVEKQLESLKRQASKARRYRVLREEMQGVERVRLRPPLRRPRDRRSPGSRERLAAEGQREQAAHVALETEEAQMEARRTALYEDEARLEEARGRLDELTLAVDRHQGKAGYGKQQIAETDARGRGGAAGRPRSCRAGWARWPPGLRGAPGRGGALRGELAAAEEEAQRRRGGAPREHAPARPTPRPRQEQARDAQVGLMGRIATFQNARASVSGSAERAAGRPAEAGRRVGRAAARARGGAGGREAAEAKRLAAPRRRLATPRARARRGRGPAPPKRALRAEALAREAEGLQSEVSSLRRPPGLARGDGEAPTPPSTRACAPCSSGPEGLDVLGVVADALETDKTHERAVEAFMGDRLQAVLVPDAAQALRGIRYLQESGAGRGAFLPLASGAHQGRLRSAARDRGPGAEGQGPPLRLLPRDGPARGPDQGLASRRPRGGEPRGRPRRSSAARAPCPA